MIPLQVRGEMRDWGPNKIAYYFGPAIVYFMAILLLTCSITFVFGGKISVLHLPAATLLTVMGLAVLGVRERINSWRLLGTVFGVLSLIALLTFFSGKIYDKSFDGQTYQQEGIIQLASGWNPFLENLSSEVPHALWITHFPKGPWIQAAALYKFTSHIETGKVFNLLLILAAWSFCFSLLREFPSLPPWVSVLLSATAAFNPVAIYQSLNFYVDGQLSSLIVALSAVLVQSLVKSNRYTVFSAISLILLLVNVKFSGLIYVGFMLLVWSIGLWYRIGLRQTVIQDAPLLLALCLGTLFIGFNPYVKNTLEYGHLFYPLMGENSVDIISNEIPAPFRDMNRVEKLVASIFSTSSNSKTNFHLKWPFFFSKWELFVFDGHDLRIGGWGPLFGGMMILSVIPIVFGLVKEPNNSTVRALVGIIIWVLASGIIHPEGWWARYAPQLWLIPVASFSILFFLASARLKVVGILGVLLAMANLFLVGGPYLYGNYKTTISIQEKLHQLSQREEVISVFFGPFASNRIRLSEAGIEFRKASKLEDLPCSQTKGFLFTYRRARVCEKTPKYNDRKIPIEG